MSFNFRDLIRKTNPTAAELRAAVTKLSVEEAEAKVTTLEAEHRRLLIEGTEAEVEAVEQKILAATRDVQRVAIAIEEFTTRISAAEAREAAETLDKVEADQIKAWQIIKAEYLGLHRQCEKLAADLRRIQAMDAEFAANNRALASAGRSTAKVTHPVSNLATYDHPSGRAPSINEFVLPGYFMYVDPNSITDLGARRPLNFGALKDVQL